MQHDKHLPRTVPEYMDWSRQFVAEAAAAYKAAPLRPRSTDLIISPYAKCGTTFLQQMFHSLRTRGDMDFDSISRVVPWIELAPLLGLDLNAPQRAAPRGFKSHLGYDRLPKGARYVVSIRDPKDSFVSMYHFASGFMIEPGAISMEQYFEVWAQGGGPEGEGYFGHLKSWWAVRDRPNVLLISYNDLLSDRRGCIRRLADFVDIPLDDALLNLTLERTSRPYMLEHKDQFDETMMRHFSEVAGGDFSLGSDSFKVRPGSSGDHKSELPRSIGERLDAMWEREIADPLGFADFKSLEQALTGPAG